MKTRPEHVASGGIRRARVVCRRYELERDLSAMALSVVPVLFLAGNAPAVTFERLRSWP